MRARLAATAARVASILARRGPARNPKKRMRTKPRGSVCSRNRRRNSSAETVILRCLVAVRVILPAEGDRLAIEGQEPVIGDGDPMRVPGQVLQQVLGAAERRFGVDHPLFLAQRLQEGEKRLPVWTGR